MEKERHSNLDGAELAFGRRIAADVYRIVAAENGLVNLLQAGCRTSALLAAPLLPLSLQRGFDPFQLSL